ncbi:MAG: hypothetical protein CMH22_11445 [Methylophaga sp.]|nr:hypothetical protein [Methylophaga sp.]|tara:strand:- start:232096 stop:232314 length:219 start_codon:yes stop_codon:yes gene_type:complete
MAGYEVTDLVSRLDVNTKLLLMDGAFHEANDDASSKTEVARQKRVQQERGILKDNAMLFASERKNLPVHKSP